MYLARSSKKNFKAASNEGQIESILRNFDTAGIEYGEIKDFDSQYKIGTLLINFRKIKRDLGLENISILRRGDRVFLYNANCICSDYSEPEGTQD